MNRLLSHFISGKLCASYGIELMYTFGIIAFQFICIIFSSTKPLVCGNLVMARISI